MSQRGFKLATGFGAAALVCTLFATGIVWKVTEAYDRAIEQAAYRERVHVAMASRDLYPGMIITPDDFVLTSIDPDWLPGGSTDGLFTKPEELIGRAPKQRILANEFIAEPRLSDFQTGDGLNGLIPPGMRALSLPVRDAAALGGLLEPGAYVDVIVNVDPQDGGLPISHTLAYKVFVLGVNGRTRTPEDIENRRKGKAAKPSVTLLLDPELAAQIVHGRVLGDLTLAGVNANDEPPEEPNLGQGEGDDTGEPEAPGSAVERPPPPQVETPPVDVPELWDLQVCRGTDCDTEQHEIVP